MPRQIVPMHRTAVVPCATPPRATRRLALALAPCAVTTAPRAWAARETASTMTPGTIRKQIFNDARGRATTYPPWMLGEWTCATTFVDASFPRRDVDARALARVPDTPGFRALSVARVPDVGREGTIEHRVRFVRVDGKTREDVGFNLMEIIDAYVGADAVEAVTTDGDDRTTIRLKPRASPNAERIELFTNARESGVEGDAFYVRESFRQVSLGYGTEYGNARVAPTDYEHRWTYTPLPDVPGGAVDETNVNKVHVKLVTAAYVQGQDALRLTASSNPRGAPVPKLGDAAGLAFEPVIVYTHVSLLERVGCVP
ncbi:hypothetical protein BE221DRAFT_67219 [Ostreococcus tauri]|uniref:DUF6816 domain-containing protein n=2 Tax=Ostreococcus tauri TaxID=70448 RepID=A0A1Y5IH57_OSTTA|nr:hypothetical protein BE221DRAFT_67219 [Ostreococcus tauri]